MGWPTIPPALVASDQVTIQRVGAWTQDRGGGRVQNMGTPSSPVACSFKPGIPVEKAVNHRDSMVAKYTVTFANTNPLLHINDQLNWLNENKRVTVVGTETAGPSDARLWLAYVEERPAL